MTTGSKPESSVVKLAEKTFPIIEVFGPTIQGEGALCGHQTLFVRFGGCDFRCSWCDTMYAVDPEEVRKRATKMSVIEIVDECLLLSTYCPWVTLSGGNPALFDLDYLVRCLKASEYKVAVETQGSLYKAWLGDVDLLTVSPKPPSSGMPTNLRALRMCLELPQSVLKIVVNDWTDLEYVKKIKEEFPDVDLYLQPCKNSTDESLGAMIDHYNWLAQACWKDPNLSDAIVLPQLHVWTRNR